jgi:hypothetical protein
LVPVGILKTGHVWLHGRCREAWRSQLLLRRQKREMQDRVAPALRKVKRVEPPQCIECGSFEDSPDNPLLKVACAGPGARDWVHVRCWSKWREDEQDAPAAVSDTKMFYEGGAPNLRAWVKHYGGCRNIPWKEWDDAVARARESKGER